MGKTAGLSAAVAPALKRLLRQRAEHSRKIGDRERVLFGRAVDWYIAACDFDKLFLSLTKNTFLQLSGGGSNPRWSFKFSKDLLYINLNP